MSGHRCQALLQSRLSKRQRRFGERGQRQFPAGLILACRTLDRPRGLLQIAGVDGIEPAVVALAEVGTRHHMRRVDTICLQAAGDIGAQHLHGNLHGGRRDVDGLIGGQPGADQEENRIVQQRLRHAHLSLQVLAHQQMRARGETFGQQVGRQQTMSEAAEHHGQRMPDTAVRRVGGAARLLLLVAHIVERQLQRQPGLAQHGRVRARRGQAQRAQQGSLEALARPGDSRCRKRRQHDTRQHLQLVEPQVCRMHALFLHQVQRGGIGLVQAQRVFGVASHQVVDVLGQRLHAGAEHRERFLAGGHRAGVDGLEQAAQCLAIGIHAAQPDDMHRACGLMQLLAGQPQRSGIARAQRLRRLLDLVHVVAEFDGGIVERGTQAWREPGQHRQVALRRGGCLRRRNGSRLRRG